MKYAAFDLETWKITPEGEDIKGHRPLGISCAAIHLTGEGHPMVFCHNVLEPEPMLRSECQNLVLFLETQITRGFIPLTWNGAQFDFDILAEESGLHQRCANLTLQSIDMMYHLFSVKGFPLGIQAVADGFGIEGKTEGMHGDLAPVMWRKGDQERAKVLEYVGQDATLTLAIAHMTEEKGFFTWRSKKGRLNSFYLLEHQPDFTYSTKGGRWLAVKECMELPKPDQSWMTNPIPPSQFIEWMKL